MITPKEIKHRTPSHQTRIQQQTTLDNRVDDDSGRWPTIQRGPRRPWDTIEHATRRWSELDQPTRDRYGITALTDTDRQYVWLDDPNGPYSWPMPL